MSKQVDQGTRHESHIVSELGSLGYTARRLAKTGRKHEPDIEIVGETMLPLLWWKRYLVSPGKKRRETSTVVVMSEDTFKKIVDRLPDGEYGYYIQAKASQKESVTTLLKGLTEWME